MSENCYFVDPVDPGPFFLVHRNVFGIPYVTKNLRGDADTVFIF